MKKSELAVRWLVLFLSCIVMIGNYYCFDNPAALKSQLEQHFHELPKDQYEFLFNLLYTLYSIPNIMLPFFGGFLVDRLGSRITLLTFTIVISVGQIVFAIGCSVTEFKIMLLGRIIFGLGGESLGVAQSTLVASWFKNKELALALGINLSVARLGSVFNNELSPLLAQKYNVSYALWMGVAMCVISILATLILLPIDKKSEDKILKITESNSKKLNQSTKETIHFTDIRQFRPAFWLLSLSCLVVYGCVIPFNNVANTLIMERDFFKQPPLPCQRCNTGYYANFSCAVFDQCPPSPPYQWPLPDLSSNCSVIHSPEQQLNCTHSPPYINEASINCDDVAWKNGKYTKKYCTIKLEAARNANTPMSVPYVISALLSPLLGFVVDKIGLRALLALIAPILLIIVHVLLGFTSVSVYVPLVLQGIAYSVFAAALWPSIPYVVEPRHVGSAYGAITSIQNFGLASFPLIVAMIYNMKHKYVPNVEVVFIVFAILGAVVGVFLNILDYQNGSILNQSNVFKCRRKRNNLSDEFNQHTEALLDPNRTEL